MHIGKVIYKFRTSKNLTVEELSKSSGVGRTFIIGIEKGDYDPTFDTLLSLCKGMGVSIQELIGVADKPEELQNQHSESEIIQFVVNSLQEQYVLAAEKYLLKRNDDTDIDSFELGAAFGMMRVSFHLLYDLEKKYGIKFPPLKDFL